MTESAGVIVRMITHRVCPTNPAHETAHFAVNQRAKYQMIVIGHQLIAVQLNPVTLQTFMQNSFKRGEVGIFAENIRSQVAAIEGMIKKSVLLGI